MEPNPYATPSANLFGSSSQTTSEAVPAEAIAQLQGTKPWVRFFSVMMWIGVFFMLLASAGIGLMAAVGGDAAKAGGLQGPAMLIGMSILYLFLGIFYIYPAVKMWQYASAIQGLMQSRNVEDLVKALGHQRAFWKSVGILVIIMVLLYIVFFVALASMGFAAAMKAGA